MVWEDGGARFALAPSCPISGGLEKSHDFFPAVWKHSGMTKLGRPRYLDQTLGAFAEDKFVLLTGPRQVGKTTLAERWLQGFPTGQYLNWDIPENRATLLARGFPGVPIPAALVLDEIHKYPRWKAWLKGLYDKHRQSLPCVVTGSARMDVFQKGGDSLLGRHELLHLHPFSIGELTHGRLLPPPATSEEWLELASPKKFEEDHWAALMRFSGFPEPLFKASEQQYVRWSNRRRDLVTREDLRELTQIRSLGLLEHMVLLLPERIGAPLSVNSLREELSVAHDTLNHWLDAIERLYFSFRISPYHARMSRSLKKERKLYLWDWGVIPERGPRFENVVASHLLKSVQAWNDVGYGDFQLQYWRDKEKREVDFVITRSRKPVVLVECKAGDGEPSPHLSYLSRLLGAIPAIQLVDRPGLDRRYRNPQAPLRIAYAPAWLAGLS